MKPHGTSPRGPVASRRLFLKTLAGQASVLLDEISGRPQLRLVDLPELPDELLGQIKPLMLGGLDIIVDDEYVLANKPGQDGAIRLVATDRASLLVFNLFNGILPLADIAARLAETMSWDDERSFGFTRELFLHLVRLGVCVPDNSPDV